MRHSVYKLIRDLMAIVVAAVSSMKPNMDSSNCILVQDVKDVTHDQMTQGSVSTQIPTEGNPIILTNRNLDAEFRIASCDFKTRKYKFF